MPTSPWSPAVAGQPATAAQHNALLGVHPTHLAYAGTAIASEAGAETTTVDGHALWAAEKFTMSGTSVDLVTLHLRSVGSGADATVSLRADNSGAPSSAAIASIVVPADFIASGDRAVSVPLAATGLTSGATLWIVVQAAGDAANHMVISADAASSTMRTSPDGIVWGALANTMRFSVAAGSSGSLMAVSEDGGARWTELVYNGAVLAWVDEFVGAFRNVRQLLYDAVTNNLTGVS